MAHLSMLQCKIQHILLLHRMVLRALLVPMMELFSQQGLEQRVHDWYRRPPGESLQGLLGQHLAAQVTPLAVDVVVDVGPGSGVGLLPEGCLVARAVLDDRVHFCAQAEQLPLLNAGVDLLLLRHSVELAEHPEMLWQEMRRVVKPAGHLLLLGFNPYCPMAFSSLFPVPRNRCSGLGWLRRHVLDAGFELRYEGCLGMRSLPRHLLPWWAALHVLLARRQVLSGIFNPLLRRRRFSLARSVEAPGALHHGH